MSDPVSSNQCLPSRGSWISGCLIRIWCGFLVCCLVVPGRSPLGADFDVLVDEHDTRTPQADWYFNALGGDRGTLNEADAAYTWDEDSAYTLTIRRNTSNWTSGGMWQSLARIKSDQRPLGLNRIFGRYVTPPLQGQIIAVKLVVKGAASPSRNTGLTLRLELKDTADRVVCQQQWSNAAAGPFPKTYTWTLPATCKQDIQLLNWVLDRARMGDSFSVDRLALIARVPDLPTADQAFLWTYAGLMGNYDPSTGLVQDRSNFRFATGENVWG